jgi:hypothetical protein
MIYIPHIKKRIDELAPRWHKGTLNPEELTEFYDLLDEVVVEARESRSDSVTENQRPEAFLINLFQQRLENTIFAFLKRYKQYMAEAARYYKKEDGRKLKKTPVFIEWRNSAIIITESIILSDATTRRTRRDQIQKYLETSGSSAITGNQESMSKEDFIKERHLFANSKRLFARKQELLQQQNAWKKELRQQQDNIDWNYLPWAERCALKEGVGYDPNYKNKNIEDIKRKRPNLVNYLFGSKETKKGELFWRLVELHRFIISRKKKGPIYIDDIENESDGCSYKSYEKDIRKADNLTQESNSDENLLNDKLEKSKEFGFTKKQVIVWIKRRIEKKPISTIANELRISERMVYKHLRNIKQNPQIKKILSPK